MILFWTDSQIVGEPDNQWFYRSYRSFSQDGFWIIIIFLLSFPLDVDRKETDSQARVIFCCSSKKSRQHEAGTLL